MQPAKSLRMKAALAVPAVLLLAVLSTAGRGDEPGRLGRLFRFGGSSSSLPATNETAANIGLEGRAGQAPGAASPSALANATSSGVQPRLIPQPRVSRSVTDADPVVTRIALARADDGNQFGMFLQVYADGTVIDSEGVHHAGREGIKEILSALEQGDLYRVKGHCGGPSTDFVEQVQMIVYERSLGRLRANAFSFSGNNQGCDHAVRHLQSSLDALQAKLSRPATATATASGPAVRSPAPIQLNGGGAPAER